MKTKDRMKHFVENEIISQVKDDPRDEIIIRVRSLWHKNLRYLMGTYTFIKLKKKHFTRVL